MGVWEGVTVVRNCDRPQAVRCEKYGQVCDLMVNCDDH